MGYGVIGSTSDSGSFSLGSSPGTPAIAKKFARRPPSSSGLGRRPLTALTPVQIRLGVQVPAGLRPCFFVSCAAALGICKNKSMRIVLVSDTFRPTMGGIETQVGALADHLHARGHDIVVLTCTPEGDSPSTCPYPVLRSAWRNPFNAPIDP